MSNLPNFVMPEFKPCPCGESVCKRQYIANMGHFHVGTGFEPHEVAMIVEAFELLKAKRERQEKARKDYEALPICSDEQKVHPGLYDATPGCNGKIITKNSGGVKCNKCRGWFCW